jgi:uncharacterized membrane protein YfcA
LTSLLSFISIQILRCRLEETNEVPVYLQKVKNGKDAFKLAMSGVSVGIFSGAFGFGGGMIMLPMFF